MSDLSIRDRMILAFSLIGVLFAATTAIAWKQSRDNSSDVQALINTTLLAKSSSLVVDADVVRIHRAMKDVALSHSPQDVEKAAAGIPKLEAAVASNIAAISATRSVDAELVDRLQAALTAWAAFRAQTVELMKAGRSEEAAARTKQEGAALALKAAGLVKEMVNGSDARARLVLDEMVGSGARGRTVLAMTTSVGLALAAVVCVMLVRSITRPVASALEVAETVAAGHLEKSMAVPPGNDELSRLLQSLARMNSSLVAIVSQVRDSSENISEGTCQIAVGNQNLSRRTERQAASLEETAASMQQLTSAVRANAETTAVVGDLAMKASGCAEHGGAAVAAVVQTMNGISESSHRIAEIIGVIDAIAFQTNVLSLNAAVEAARAGEQGRGFAVVAEEVRALARKTTEAAKEIKGLIHDSVDRVGTGVRQVADAGDAMSETLVQIRRVNELVSEIRMATQEQSTGVLLIESAVSQLDQTTQQNAALVEESASAAESLRRQAEQLMSAVHMFRLVDAAVEPA